MDSNYSWFLTDRSGKRYTFIQNTISIGRRACDINLKSNSVNLKHCTLFIDELNDELKIKDLRTTNGTTLNNEPIVSESWLSLKCGDVFKLADDYTLFTVNKEIKPAVSAAVREDTEADFPTSVSRPEVQITSMKCEINESMLSSVNEEDGEIHTKLTEDATDFEEKRLCEYKHTDHPPDESVELSNHNLEQASTEILDESKPGINKPNSLLIKPAEAFVIGCDDFVASTNRNQSSSDLLKTPTNPSFRHHSSGLSELNIIETPRSDIIKPAEAFMMGCDNNVVTNKKAQSASSIDNNSTNSRESFNLIGHNWSVMEHEDGDDEQFEGLDGMQPEQKQLQSLFPTKLKAAFERREKMKKERLKEHSMKLNSDNTTHKLRSSIRSTKSSTSDKMQSQSVTSPITKTQSLRTTQSNRYNTTSGPKNPSQKPRNTNSITNFRNSKVTASNKTRPTSNTKQDEAIRRKPPPAKSGTQKPTTTSAANKPSPPRTKAVPSTRLAASQNNRPSALVSRRPVLITVADKRKQQNAPQDSLMSHNETENILPPSINVNKSFLMNKMFTGTSDDPVALHPSQPIEKSAQSQEKQKETNDKDLLEMATDFRQTSDLDEMVDELKEEEIVSQAGTYVLDNGTGNDDGRKSALSNQLNGSSGSTFSGHGDLNKTDREDNADDDNDDTSTISSKHSVDEDVEMELESKSGAESDYDNDVANDNPKKWSSQDEYSTVLAGPSAHYDRVSMGQLDDGSGRYISSSGAPHRVYDSGQSNFMAAPDLVMDNRMAYDDVNSKSNPMTDHQYGFKSDLRNLNQSDDPSNQSIDIPLSSQLPSYHKQTHQSTKTSKRTNFNPTTNSNRENQTNYQSKLITNQNTGTGKNYKKVQKKKPTASNTTANMSRKTIGSEDLYVPDYEEEQQQRKTTTTTSTNRGVIMRRQQHGKNQQKSSSHQKQMMRQTVPPNTDNDPSMMMSDDVERGQTLSSSKQKQKPVTLVTADQFSEDRYDDVVQLPGNTGVPSATRYPRSTFSVASLDTALLLQDTEALLNDMERRVYSRKDLRSFEEQQSNSTNSYSTNNPDKIPFVDEVGVEDDVEISSQVSSQGIVLNITGNSNNNASTNTIGDSSTNNANLPGSTSRNNAGVRSPINNSSSYSNSSMIRRNNSCKVPIRGTTNTATSASASISNSNAINNSITTNNLLDTSGSSNQNASLLYRNQRSTSLIEDRSNQQNVSMATNTNNLATMSPIPPSMKELNYDHQQPHNYYHNYRNATNTTRQSGKQLSGVTMPTNTSNTGYQGLRRGSASGVFYNMPPLTNNTNNNSSSNNPNPSTTNTISNNKPINIGMHYGIGGFMACVPRQRMNRYEFGQHSLKHNSSSTTMLYQKQSSLSPQWSADENNAANPNLYSPGNRPINSLYHDSNDYYPYCTMPDSFDIGTLHNGRLESDMLGASQPHLLNVLDDPANDLIMYDYSSGIKRQHPGDASLEKSGPMGFHAAQTPGTHGNMSGRSSAFSLCQSTESINNQSNPYSSYHLNHHGYHGHGQHFNFGAIPSKSRSSLGINEQKNNNYDVLLISSIHLFSARLCRYAEEIIHRLRREDLELLQTSSPLSAVQINGPGSGEGPNNSTNGPATNTNYSSDTMGRSKIQNKELSECLSNMKNLERLLQKIDKSLFPIDSTGRKSTMGNCPENVYLTHLEKIHKEIKDFVPIKPTATKPHITKIDVLDTKSSIINKSGATAASAASSNKHFTQSSTNTKKLNPLKDDSNNNTDNKNPDNSATAATSDASNTKDDNNNTTTSMRSKPTKYVSSTAATGNNPNSTNNKRL